MDHDGEEEQEWVDHGGEVEPEKVDHDEGGEEELVDRDIQEREWMDHDMEEEHGMLVPGHGVSFQRKSAWGGSRELLDSLVFPGPLCIYLVLVGHYQ